MILLITDGDSEYKGEVSIYIDDNQNITQLTAQKDISELINYLNSSVLYYNNKPHGRLFGFTPNEVLDDENPSNEVYSKSKTEARKEIILQNKTTICFENKK